MTEMCRLFITVKTYPVISKNYDELVCTAGFLEDGSWIRIYPLPFRKLNYESQYKKYQWLELPIERNTSDMRPESYKVTDITQVKTIGDPLGTQQDWFERKEVVFKNNKIHKNLKNLIDLAHSNRLSLATFKPTKLLDLVVEEVDREWSEDSLAILNEKSKQFSLFQSPEEVANEFKVVKKLPYKFSYKFVDDEDKVSQLMIEDWEIGALFWNCLERESNNEGKAIEQVRKKYWDDFIKKDLYFFLGTTKKFHLIGKNPFVIIGVFYPPNPAQNALF